MIRWLLVAGLAALVIAPVVAPVIAPVLAQDIVRIAAIVNDEVVSAYDVQQRVKLVMVSTGLADNRETRRRVARQVLRTLIDERIQLQEAKRLNISVSESDLDRAIARIERQVKIPEGRFPDFLRSQGIPMEVMVGQLRANIAWSKLVQRRLQPRVSVSEDEIDTVIARLEANAGQRELRVGEIFLSVDSPDEDEEVRRSALRLVDQIRGGARFDAVARQFSQGVTAAVGGDLGWVQPSQLPEEIESRLASMRPGGISDPIRSTGGYYVVTLREQREILRSDPAAIKLDMKQILLPLGGQASATDVATQTKLAEAIRETVTGCDDIETIGKELNSEDSGALGKLSLGDLPAKIRAAVGDLKVGDISLPVRTGAGVHLFMVCGRTGDAEQAPDPEAIRAQIGNRRLTMLARRYLRDLRRDAVVEFR